jgi:hypothetical protein
MPLPFLSLLYAEWQKVIKNSWLTGFLIWIYPVGLTAFYIIAALAGFISETAQQAMAATGTGEWTRDTLGIWSFVTAFPANILGRMLPLAFMAVVFAGEYQWSMWKNLVPRGRRMPLILAKFLVLTGMVMLSFFISSLIIGVGQNLAYRAAGMDYGPAGTAEVWSNFLRDYGREAFLAIISLVILAGYAALAAIFTRSILGGLLAGFGFSILEPMSLVILLLLGKIFDQPSLINFYQFMPSYNMDNVRSWLIHHSAFTQVGIHFTAQPSLGFSWIVLGLWVIGLVWLTIVVFERQDIVS